MLLALTRPSHSVDFANLDISTRHLDISTRNQDPALCQMQTLKAYEVQTARFRMLHTGTPHTKLFLSWIGKHALVTTIAGWLRTCLLKAGIDTSVFKACSVRGASSSTAASSGVTISVILKAADWLSRRNFLDILPQKLGVQSGLQSISTSICSIFKLIDYMRMVKLKHHQHHSALL